MECVNVKRAMVRFTSVTMETSYIHRLGVVWGILGLLCPVLVSSKDVYSPREFADACVASNSFFLCDPEGIFSGDEAEEIIDSLRLFQDVDFSSSCANNENRIMVAAVPGIKSSTGGPVEGFDNQLEAAEEFAEYLRDQAWSKFSSDCGAFIVIVHDKYGNLSWIATNYNAKEVISNSCVTNAAIFARSRFLLKGRRKEGILYLSDTFRTYLDGSITCSGSSASTTNAFFTVLTLTSLLIHIF